MKKIWLGALALLALSGCSTPTALSFFSSLPSGVTLLEEVEAQPDKVMIPYSKYRLDNGLTVILSPDHSDPLVHVDMTYHVGSAREELGKSGFAHFFEHMMFQGSKHVADQEHFRLITEAGGRLNGTTNRDRTNYFQTVPANQLEKVLWLEADRMGFLLDAVSQRKFEIQRDTVKNERAQNYDNRPYGLIWERMAEALYPQGHPYSWQTIGYVEDLDRVDVNDLKAFFLRWYGPNNAVLTIGGDIDVKQTLAWVNRYFGSIPKGPEVDKAEKQPVTLAEDRYITLEDRIQQPMVLIGFPTAYRGAEQQASLDALAQVLGSGSNSLLYQNLVRTQKAVDAGAFQDCAELACTFYIYAMAPSGQRAQLTPLYQEIMRTLAQFEQQGVSDDRLAQITGMAEANAIFALQSVQGKVTQLASNQTFYDQPDRIEAQLAQLRAVTPQSVTQVFQTYLHGKPKVTLSVVPRGRTSLAVRQATFVTPERLLPVYQKITEQQLEYRQVVDNFDRSVMPAVAQAVQINMPELYEIHFDNGAELIGTVSSETPTVQVEIRLPAGERHVEAGKEGLANLTAALIKQDSAIRNVEDIQAELDKLGSTISLNTGAYSTNVVISSLTKHLPETLRIAQEMLLTPGFKQEDFERLQQQMLQSVVYQHQQPSWLAGQAMRQVLFGDSVFARSSDGTQASIAALTLDEVKAFYQQHYTPHGAQVIVVGDIEPQQVREQLAFFTDWHGQPAPILRPQVIPTLTEQRLFLVDKPDSPQSVVRFVRRGLPFDATGEMYLTQLTNFNLAGNFNSRINQNLREDKGYTYGASGYLSSNREVGAIVFNAQVRANATLPAIQEIIQELTHFSQYGLTTDEMAFLRLAVGQQEALSYETPSQKAQLIGQMLTNNLDRDYLQQRNRLLKTVNKSTLNELAAKWFVPEDYQIIVVGDAKSLRPQLEKLSIPIEELEIIQ
ncbi:M16 family metallopeptidase [Vibrio metschnikovii]|uniref:M16 family metallopeptidase n=1 Tax=Vibrio metschnikovii TaxID=28172 RepID=UPI001C2F3592|nr:pitrilysin family protein [Vibrio metschnikovii]